VTHAILIRHVDPCGSVAQTLAYDIDTLDMATEIADGIVSSYPMHGRNGARNTFWFVNARGLHELLVV
jgi:hypothetical protein